VLKKRWAKALFTPSAQLRDDGISVHWKSEDGASGVFHSKNESLVQEFACSRQAHGDTINIVQRSPRLDRKVK
jgi:hypothetical protein